MSLAPLYQLTPAFLAVQRELEARDDLPEEVIREMLERERWPLEEKLRDVVGYSQALEAEGRMIAHREAELTARRRRLECRAAWLRSYALEAMRAAKIDRLDSPDFTARVRANPGAAQITNEALLPEDLVRVKTIREPDKAEIRERLLAGVEVPGAALRITWRLDVR